MSRKVRFGLVGLGGWANMIAAGLNRQQNAVVHACSTRNKENRKAFAKATGCIPAESYEAMLADPDLDAVLLMTPNHVHKDQAVAAAKAGKHVFTDKPIANTLKDSFAIYRACKKNRVKLCVGHNTRRTWGVRTVKKMIDKGELGKINMVEADFSHNGGMFAQKGNWRFHTETCPSGPLIQLGVHHIDTMLYLFGPITEVAAMFESLLVPGTIDDTTATLFRFKNGIIGYNGSGYTCKPAQKWMKIMGTEGVARVETHRVEVMTEPSKGQVTTTVHNAPQTWGGTVATILEELTEFADAILKKKGVKIEVGGKEAIEALAPVEAAIQAAKTGRTVSIKSLLGKYGKLT